MQTKLTIISVTAILVFGLAVYPSIADDNTLKDLVTVPAHLAPVYGSIGADIPLKNPPSRPTSNSITALGLLPTASPGTQVGTTTWEYQHNASMGRQIEHRGTDILSVVWTCSYSTILGEQRNIHQRRYDLTSCSRVSYAYGDSLIKPTSYSGFVSLDMDPAEGCPIVAFHFFATTSNIYAVLFDMASCYNPAAAIFSATYPFDGYGYYGTDTYNVWPKIEWQVGTETVLHMVATEGIGTGPKTMSYYRRVGPYGTTGPLDDTLFWSDQHVIDTVTSTSVTIAASPNSDKVAIVWAAPCDYVRDTPSEFVNTYNNDIWYAISENQGEDWASAPTPANPSIGNLVDNSLLTGRNVTTYDEFDEYKAYCEISTLFDSEDNLHIVWSGRHWTDGITIDRRNSAIFHWADNRYQIIPVVIADWDDGGSCYAHSYGGDVSKMSISECDGKLYVLYTQFGNPEAPCSDIDNENYVLNGELYLVASKSNGMAWDTPQNLTNSETPDCASGDCDSDNWASMARYGRTANGCGGGDSPPSEGYALDILYINDKAPGEAMRSTSGVWTVNPVLWLTTPCRDVIYGGDQFYEAVNYYLGGGPWHAAAADFDNDGDIDLVTDNSGITVLKNNGDGTFAGPDSYPSSSSSDPVAADLDGDGDYDLAMRSYDNNSVYVHSNNGDGSFEPAVIYAVGTSPRGICAADLDNDSDIDLVTANYASKDVSVLLNDGGIFTLDSNYEHSAQLGAVAAADLNGDGYQDLVIAGRNWGGLYVRLNRGDGTFAPASLNDANWTMNAITAADLDGDGDIDLAAAFTKTYVAVFMNFGDGTFDSPVRWYVGGDLRSIRAFDMDRDNDYDLVTNDRYSSCVDVLENKGDGTFEQVVRYAAGNQPVAVIAADLNGDYNLDLAVANYLPGNVSILLNTDPPPEPGEFSYPVSYDAGDGLYFVHAADIDGDDDNDLITANCGSEDISVLKNQGFGTFEAAVHYSYVQGDCPYSVISGDLDEDGDLDLVTADAHSDNIMWFENDGLGVFTWSPTHFSIPNHEPRIICVADLDNDDDLEIAVPGVASDTLTVLWNDDDNDPDWFDGWDSYDAGNGPNSACAIDLNADGAFDIAVANQHSDDVTIYLNDGLGNFSATTYAAGDYPRSVFAADLDGDDDQDLVVANLYANTVTLLENDGAGAFAHFATADFAVGANPYYVSAADLDGDNDNDLAVANSTDDNVSILLNDGAGVFTWEADYPVGDKPTCVIASDLDGDGDNDLAVSHLNSGDIAILFNMSPPPLPDYICGDANGDESINVGDAVYLINYIFKGGNPPDSLEAGEVNCDGSINVGDAVYLINYIFKGGNAPCFDCR